ncbi:hypothetical protein CR513_34632, partial [Mucuna pruriens]
MENEGHVINRPPLFKVQNYNYWKQRMVAFFDACHIDMWDVVENGEYIPTNKVGTKIPRSSWNDDKKTMFLFNSKARNFLMYLQILKGNVGHFDSSLRRNFIGKRFQDKCCGPQVTPLRVSKELKKLPMEELLGTLKVHEIKLNEDKGQRKGKSIAFKAQKT